jgi:hypothetical protein
MENKRLKRTISKLVKKTKPPVKTGNMKMKTPAGAEARKEYGLKMQKFNKATGVPVRKRAKPKR